MSKTSNYSLLKNFSKKAGVDLFGVSDISKIKHEFVLSENLLKKVNFALSLGTRISPGVLEDVETSPTRLYFHHYRTVNAFLDHVSLKITNFIQSKGFIAVPIPASHIIDWDKQTAHLSHRKLALMSGLGWIGRNNLLVNSKLGSQLRLSTILTDMPLKEDKPTKEDCGLCFSCIKHCPAEAIKEKPEDFDHIKCFEKLKEFQKQRMVDQYICGICVNVCKGNKK